MSWVDWHRQSEASALEAAKAMAERHVSEAYRLYRVAAEQEEHALGEVASEKPRTYGIVAVSAVSLWYKAAEYDAVERLAYKVLQNSMLPEFAAGELRLLVQSVWNDHIGLNVTHWCMLPVEKPTVV